ncbi:LysM peptidoglycan-binding domain-containing protein [Streptomyces sp. NPDC127038]|uniref:LysM peptidoglycan-binding domain-containing protein n=1 Tax=Streptomyces sp. NPDC127038 TaxID=3347114 RepID=UPI00365FAEE6
MPHSPAPTPRAGLLHAAARALLALGALTVLVVGVPGLLLAVGTVPAHLPSVAGVRHAVLSQDDSGTGLFTTMTLAAWAAWLWLTFPILIEVAAVLARRTTPRLPGMLTGQRLAGYLIASVLIAAPAATAGAATLTAAPTATAPHAPGTAPVAGAHSDAPSAAAIDEDRPDGVRPAPAAPAAEAGQYTVPAGGTTWWELADEVLGDGARYQELRSLNPQIPNGLSLLPAGTTVHVPAAPASTVQQESGMEPAAYTQPTATSTTEKETGVEEGQGTGTYTVRPGDSLSAIAQHRLGNAAQWPQLYAASKGRSQPHGLPRITDPDVIYPGQTVALPHTTAPQPTSPHTNENRHGPAHKTPHAPGPSSQASGSPDKPEDRHHTGTEADPAPSASSPQTAPRARDSGPSTASPDVAPSASSSAPDATEPAGASSRTTELRTTLGAFALLAAAVTGALGTRRLLQRRRRRVGETIAIAEEPSPAAAQLTELADPPLSPRFDRALRTLARDAEACEQPLPGLRVARLSQKSLSVLPVDEAATPLSPFTAGADGWWLLPDDAQLLTADQAAETPAPYPAFVTIGADETTGDLILLNVAADRVLLLDGSDDDLRQVCRSLVLELGMSEWADRLEIVTVGFGEELTHLLPTMRIGHKRQAAHALRDMADWLLACVQLPDDAHQPYLLVCASSLDSEAAWQLAEMLDKAGAQTAMLVAPAEQTARHFGQAQIIDASATAAQQLDGTDVTFVLQRLDDAAYRQITTDLQISGQPPIPADGAWQAVPDEPDETTTGAQTQAAPPSPATTERADASGPADLGVFPALLSATSSPADEHTAQPQPAAAMPSAHSPVPPSLPPVAAVPDRRPDGGHRSGPILSVLGTVQINGISGSSHGPREAQLAALLHFKPGRSADTLCSDMDPLAPWTKRTLNSRMGDLRRTLGDDPQGNPYVPRRSAIDDPYVISEQVRCDWDEFKTLAEQALLNGPSDVTVLETALGMVRGRPFGGHLLPWAEAHAQEMITRILDVAHTVAQWRTAPGPDRDLVAARQAVSVGLEVDDSAELLYRDWFRIEHASGNRSGLHTAISRIQQVNRSIDASLELETQDLIHRLLDSQAELADAG